LSLCPWLADIRRTQASRATVNRRRYEQENKELRFDNITSIGLWVGVALIVLAWIKAIPLLLGWFGFAIAVPSFIVEVITKKNMPPSNGDDNSG
jgi:hypothetical protein